MSVQTQIDRISGNVSAALAAIAEKGVTVPDGSNSDALHELILSIEAGGGNIYTEMFSVSENMIGAVNLTFEHNLGRVPTCFVICTDAITYDITQTIGTTSIRDVCYILGSDTKNSTAFINYYKKSGVTYAATLSQLGGINDTENVYYSNYKITADENSLTIYASNANYQFIIPAGREYTVKIG